MQTTQRYIRTITRMISFILRCHLNDLEGLHLTLSAPLPEKADQLISRLSEGEDACMGVHELIVAILNQYLPVGAGQDWPGYYFIVFDNVLLSGKIRDVDDIRGTLSELKWPLRAATFYEIVQRTNTLGDGMDPNP
jgi:hypothetical protein